MNITQNQAISTPSNAKNRYLKLSYDPVNFIHSQRKPYPKDRLVFKVLGYVSPLIFSF